MLGNDVEDDSTPQLPIKEVVRKNTSSKKSDVPPPSADPAKAKKKSKPTGNEGALKNKPNNKVVPPPSSTASKHYKKPLDRHSRSGKSDSAKKIKQGWGSDDKRELEAETDAVEDAVQDLADEDHENVEKFEIPKQSLTDYFAELQLKQQELGNRKASRKANEGSEDKWSSGEVLTKQQESYVSPSASKRTKGKSQKEKKFLNFEASFADETHSSSSRPPFKKGGKKNFAPRKPKPAVNDKNFPSL